MRSTGFLGFVVLLVWVGACRAVAGVPDWLKAAAASAPPLESGYAQVVLHEARQVRYTGLDSARVTERRAIRILGDAARGGIQPAVVFRPSCEKVASVRLWFISADGGKIREHGRGDFMESVARVSTYFWDDQRELAFPTAGYIEPGSVVAWEFVTEVTLGAFDFRWAFATNVPVVESVFEVEPTPGATLAWNEADAGLPRPESLPGGGMRWTMRGIVPVARDLPEGFIAAPQIVSARCMGGRATIQGDWSAFSRLCADYMEPAIGDSSEVAANARALTVGLDARWDRIRALCEFVQRGVSYLSVTLGSDTMAGYRPHAAGEVLANRFGDCKDKAALLCALLRSIGEPCEIVLVYAGDPTRVPKAWPSLSFNHAIVAIRADQDVPPWWPVAAMQPPCVLFDPTDPDVPLGVLPRVDQGGHGLVVGRSGAGLITLPQDTIASSRVERQVNIAVSADLTCGGSVEEKSFGTRGATSHAERRGKRTDLWRRRLEKALAQSIPAARLTEVRDQWDPAASTFAITWAFAGGRSGAAAAGGGRYLSPFLIDVTEPLEPWRAETAGSIWVAPTSLRETVRIKPPAGWSVAEVPTAFLEELDGARASVTYTREGDEIIGVREVALPGGLFDRRGYESARALTKRIANAERRPILLKKL